jgi:Ca-activated chloride channel family protein
MEYFYSYPFYLTLLCALAWFIDAAGFFKKSNLYIPSSYVISNGWLRRLPVILCGIIAWGLLVYSSTFPRLPIGFSKQKIEVKDIFFVVDVSRSMLANDFKPNRLEVSKIKIKEFVQMRPNDRVGIVMFAEKVFTLLPLTMDLDLVQQVTDEIQIGFLGNGTNIGDALALGVARVVQSLAKTKIIILLTDGVSNVGTMTPLQAAEEAKKQNVKIYSIGVGGDDNAQIPTGSGLTSPTYQNIPGGSIDFESLKQISEMTGGKSYLAKNSESLKSVLADISELEKTEIETSGQTLYEEKFYNFFLKGLLLLFFIEVFRRLFYKEYA